MNYALPASGEPPCMFSLHKTSVVHREFFRQSLNENFCLIFMISTSKFNALLCIIEDILTM